MRAPGEYDFMTTVNWERMSGEDVELFVAAALTKGRGGGCQITPSSGDGGIDVLLPKDDGTWEVVQVKRFSRPLTSKQKTNVRKSWDRFREQDLTGYEISAWTLAMPWNATREALEWLQTFPPETTYTKTWMGRTNLDNLAADNLQLVDYYFGDGGTRIQGLMTLGIEVGRPTAGLGESDLLEGVLGRHEALAKALDEVDPFYSYEISVKLGSVPLDDKACAAEAVGAAMVQFAKVDDERYSVMRVIPRHPLALQLRPIRQKIRFEAQPGTPEHQMLTDFSTYGVPFQAVVGDVVEAAGPPGTDRKGLSLFSFTARVNEEFPPLELRGIGPDGVTVATLPLLPPETSSGFTGERFWLKAKDLSGLVTLEMRIGGTDKLWELNLRHGSLIGQPAVEASRVGEFYLALTPSHELSLAQVGGKELMAPFQLNSGLTEAFVWRLVDVYARLQKHTHDRVLLPDLGQLTQDEINRLHNTVKALDGEEVEVPWHSSTLPLPADKISDLLPLIESTEPFESLEVFDFPMPLGGITVALPGRLASRLLSCHLALRPAGTDPPTSVVISPADSNRALLIVVDESFDTGYSLGTSWVDETAEKDMEGTTEVG